MNYKEEMSLTHFGKLGMKWGIRRSSGGAVKVSKRPKASTLSDTELRSRINRLQMEKQYNELSSGKVAKGKRMATKILGTAVTGLATAYVTKGIVKGGKALSENLTAKISEKVLNSIASAMNG